VSERPIIEEWRKVRCFEGFAGASELEVSDYGRLKRNGQVVPPIINDRGYSVDFCKGGHRESLGRLVLITFEGPPLEGLHIVYRDGNKKNCRLDNLMWGSRSDGPKKIKTLKVKPEKRKRPDPGRKVFDAWLEKQKVKNASRT